MCASPAYAVRLNGTVHSHRLYPSIATTAASMSASERDPVRQSALEKPLYNGAFLGSFWNCEAFAALGFTVAEMVANHEWFASEASFRKFLAVARETILGSTEEPVLSLAQRTTGERYGERACINFRIPREWPAHYSVALLLSAAHQLAPAQVNAAQTLHQQLLLLCTLPGWTDT